MFTNLKHFFTHMKDVPAMASRDTVSQNIPANTIYVTLATVLVVEPTSPLMDPVMHTIPVTSLADGEKDPMQVCYMLHDGQDFQIIRNKQVIISVSLSNIVSLHRFQGGGFVLKLTDARGIAVSSPTPVQSNPDLHYKTIKGVTDLTGGWLKELEPYGVQVIN